jgi:hypothetical protein
LPEIGRRGSEFACLQIIEAELAKLLDSPSNHVNVLARKASVWG